MQHWSKRSSSQVKVRIKPPSPNILWVCVTFWITETALSGDISSLPPPWCIYHCVIVECCCKMMKEAISLWFWRTDTQTWHLLLMLRWMQNKKKSIIAVLEVSQGETVYIWNVKFIWLKYKYETSNLRFKDAGGGLVCHLCCLLN